MPKQIAIVDRYIDETSLKQLLSDSPQVTDVEAVDVREWRTLCRDAKLYATLIGDKDVHAWSDEITARKAVQYAACLGDVSTLAYSWQTKSHLPGEIHVKEFTPVRAAIRHHVSVEGSRYTEWSLRPNCTLLRVR